MDEELMDDRHPGNAELTRRLDAFADLRLRPDAVAMVRVRENVMREAAIRLGSTNGGRHHGVSPLDGSFEVLAGGRTERAAARVRAPRRTRVLLALLAAALGLLVMSGVAFAGSQAGGPLYDARVWLETVTLPSDPSARIDAQIARLQDRLDEASSATTQNNGQAVRAALDAYDEILAETLAIAGGDLTHTQRLESSLGRHQAVLVTLAARLPAGAQQAIQRVLERNNRAVDAIKRRNGSGPPSTTPGGRGPGTTPGAAGPTRSPAGAERSEQPQPLRPPRPSPRPPVAPAPTPTRPPAATPKPAARPSTLPQAAPPSDKPAKEPNVNAAEPDDNAGEPNENAAEPNENAAKPDL
jgi:hypothetical protein